MPTSSVSLPSGRQTRSRRRGPLCQVVLGNLEAMRWGLMALQHLRAVPQVSVRAGEPLLHHPERLWPWRYIHACCRTPWPGYEATCCPSEPGPLLRHGAGTCCPMAARCFCRAGRCVYLPLIGLSVDHAPCPTRLQVGDYRQLVVRRLAPPTGLLDPRDPVAACSRVHLVPAPRLAAWWLHRSVPCMHATRLRCAMHSLAMCTRGPSQGLAHGAVGGAARRACPRACVQPLRWQRPLHVLCSATHHLHLLGSCSASWRAMIIHKQSDRTTSMPCEWRQPPAGWNQSAETSRALAPRAEEAL
jgi:hypothetical protein